MVRSVFPIALSFLFVLSVSCGKEEGKVEESNLKTGRLTIIYSGNVGGRVNPCGCRIPLGGFPRRATAVKNIREEAKNVLVLDSGAMLYSNFFLYPPYDYISRILSHLIADLVNEIGTDALNVATYDLANSADSLLAFDRKYPSKWLSANIVWRNSGELIFQPDAVFTVGGFRVGVFGLIDDKSQGIDMFPPDYPVTALDPGETARKEVEKLGKDCDVVIALAYMDFERAKKLAEEVPGINVIVASHTREHSPSSDHIYFQPAVVGNTILVRCPDGGRVIGRLDLSIVKGSTEFVNIGNYADLRPEALRKKDPTPLRSTYAHEFIDLSSDIPSDPLIRRKIEEVTKVVHAYTDSIGLEYKVQ